MADTGQWFQQRANEFAAPYKGIANAQNLKEGADALLRFIDDGIKFPKTTTATTFALTLHLKLPGTNGYIPIGAVHECSHTHSLTVDEEFDVNLGSRGVPRALIPQNTSGRSITFQRYDLYTSRLEQVIGGQATPLLLLSNQLGPLSMRFMWKSPKSSNPLLGNSFPSGSDGGLYAYAFLDCYMTSMQRTMSAQNVIVGTSGTITWRTVVPVL